jgi:hypothetical protein
MRLLHEVFVAINVASANRNQLKSDKISVNPTSPQATATIGKSDLQRGQRLSVAPMMDWTDKNKNLL